MTNSNLNKSYRISLIVSISLMFLTGIFAQDKMPDNLEEMNVQAQKLVRENKYLEALPLMEKLAPFNTKDAEFMAQYGIAVITNSIVLKTPEARKKELLRGLEILGKAKDLGTENVKALHLLESYPEDDSFVDNFTDENPKISEALREGESFFGRGEYDKAFTAYEKAHKIDPKNYEAMVFMGDSLYAQKKYAESEIWFAKAAELQPNREMAFRYWGDALLFQKRFAASLDKFAEAMIAEPFSRMTWDSFKRWSELSESEIGFIELSPPGNEPFGEIIIDEKLLNSEDGTNNWQLYNDVRREQLRKNSINNSRHTLADEFIAWKKVAEAARDGIKTGKIKKPDGNLIRLIKVDDAGLLEPYLLLLRGQKDFQKDYIAYRAKNRAKMKKFIIEYMFGIVDEIVERNET